MISVRYSRFFQELAKNNNKVWFDQNRKVYEQEVKLPFLDLLAALIPAVEKLEPEIAPNPKDALFRINRDIRFAKDKTPYHCLMKASFSAGPKKSALPGFYLGIGADTIHVGGGVFKLKTADLKRVRQQIAKHPQMFSNIVNHPSFLDRFGSLKGEQAKRLEPVFKAILVSNPEIAHKQFYAMQELALKDFLDSDQLPQVILASFQSINPLYQFLKQALQ